ncbi:MAG: tRNA dihydrouridine synthase DusB [Cytophagales bacterium]|nr:tRNA dihydrouridine synthase DusB [Cytophagales bacterium]
MSKSHPTDKAFLNWIQEKIQRKKDNCPLLLLAPMEDVSDPPFRKICKEMGADIMYTEFISSESLIRNIEKSKKKLDIFSYERPIGIQLFGHDIDSMVEAAALAEQVEPDLIDINYGCPVKKVTCKGAGAAILQDLPKMQSMTEKIVKQVKVPVTVKTRLGWNTQTIRIEEAVLRLQDAGISALSLHARTRQQMYKGEADWTYIRLLKENPRIKIPIFGNGDIKSPQIAHQNYHNYKADGLMIGRASIGCPWIFRDIRSYFNTGEIPPAPSFLERLNIIRRHLQLSMAWKGERVGILEMRRHYGPYLRGLPHIKKIKERLLHATSAEEIKSFLDAIINNSQNISPHTEYLFQYEGSQQITS